MSEWVIAGQWAVSSPRNNWYGKTYRQIIQASVIPFSGSKVRLTFKASSGGVLDITNCFVGLCEGTNPAGAAFKETPTRVEFSGANSASVAAGGIVVSDEVDFDFVKSDGDALIVSFAVSSQRFHANTVGKKTATAGVTLHQISGSHAGSMPGDLGGDIFRFDDQFTALSVAKVEFLTTDIDPDGPVTKNIDFDFAIEGYDSEWEVKDEWTPNGNSSSNWAGDTLRQTFFPAAIAPGPGVLWRITAKSGANSMKMDECFIAGASGNYGYAHTPVRVTWGGSNSLEMGPNEERVSDPIEMSYDPASNTRLVVGMYFEDGNTLTVGWPHHTTIGNHVLYYKQNVRDVETQAATGYSTSNSNALAIVKIEAIAPVANSLEVSKLTHYSVHRLEDDLEVTKLSLYSVFREMGSLEVSKLATYSVMREHDSLDVSKFSLYVIEDVRFEVELTCDYAVETDGFQTSISFDYAILSPEFEIDVISDYAILGAFETESSFDYAILGAFENSLSFDYSILGPIETSITFDYQIFDEAFSLDMVFDYALQGFFLVDQVFDYGFEPDEAIESSMNSSYLIEDQPPVDAPVIRLFPMEPVTEAWAWKTLVSISHTGNEQRIALRQRPRIMINYNIALPDELDRISAYNQLYSSIGKSPKIPFYQYLTPLLGTTPAGSNELFFDPDTTYIQSGTPMCLYRRITQQYLFVDAISMTPTGCLMGETFAFNIGPEWEVMPVYFMRLPNLNSISMEALTGEYSLAGEQAYRRRFLRLESVAVVPIFQGYPLLNIRPIAVNSIEERFDSNAEVIDNGTGMPKPYSSYENPFVDGNLSWLVDRETDMDFWRTFADAIRGKQKTFLLPTWREDLTVVSQGVDYLDIEELSYADQFQHGTYGWLQLETEDSTYHRGVVNVSPIPGGLRVTLGGSVPSGIETVSFLNKVRLNEDTVRLEHYRHHSTISLPIRTVNE